MSFQAGLKSLLTKCNLQRCSRLYAPKIREAMPQSGAPLWICVEEEDKYFQASAAWNLKTFCGVEQQ